MLVQRELEAARKALKHSLKELDSAEGDRARLQKQVNKLSRTLQVSPPPPPLPMRGVLAVLPLALLMQSTVVAVFVTIHLVRLSC